MLKLKIFLTLIVLMLATHAGAQYFLTGQDPASIRWRQINTANFRLVFPADDSLSANRLANMLQAAYGPVRFDLQSPAVKTDVIFHNRSVISNAMVGWAPRRMDFYHTAPPDGYAQDWFKQLTLHELRHVAQVSSMHKGFGNALRVLFGQQGTAGQFGLFVPFWFVEGDAVATETAMSFSGRGRSPLFEAGLRAQLLEIGYYLYDKAYFGSYRDHTPDVYELGYFIVGHNRYKFGPAVWEMPMNQVARRPFTLLPFTSGIRKASGYGKLGLYNETMFDLFEIWKKQADTLIYTPYDKRSPERSVYTNYFSPQVLEDGSVVALRASKDDVRRIVRITDLKEEVLFTPASMLEDNLSATDSLVVWCEYRPDPRWSNRDFSVIMIGNLHTGELNQIGRNSRYFSPSITCDNKRIAVTEPSITGSSSLLVIDAADGRELFRFTSDTLSFQTPSCLPSTDIIAAVAVGNSGKSIILVNMQGGGTVERNISFAYDDISITDAASGALLFSAGKSGISNIYKLDLVSFETIQLTSSRYGASDAVFDDTLGIVYADYTSSGSQIVSLAKVNQWTTPYGEVEHSGYRLADLLSSMSVYNIDQAAIPDSAFITRPYRKGLNLFNLHSWVPLSGSIENLKANPGLNLMSQNSLSTAVTTFQYTYNTNEQTSRYELGFEYHGWYPVLTINASNEYRRGLAQKDDQLVPISWIESTIRTGSYVPLQYHSGAWVKGLVSSVNYQLTERRMDKEIPLRFRDPVSHSISYGVYGYFLHRRSERDLMPRQGISVQSIYRHTVEASFPANQFYTNLNVYVPGLNTHHGVKVNLSFEEQKPGTLLYGQYIAFPRGYIDLFYLKNYSLKMDYAAPLWYPDWVLPTISYLKRIRGGIFADAYKGYFKTSETVLYSAGAELLSDWHFLNFPFPVTLGGRISYRHSDGKWVPEFLYSIDTSALY